MSKVVDVAQKEIGTTESPFGSNSVKYNDWMYNKKAGEIQGPKYPWCGCFISWCFNKAGVPLPTIDYKKGFAGCTYAVNNIHKWGRVIDKSQVQMDDIVFFDWDNNKTYDHCGIFVRDNVNGQTFTTIEGNTSVPTHGMTIEEAKQANSNGGAVMWRTDRRYAQAIFVRPNILEQPIA